ncbi:MAG: hypothetical protein OQK82_01770 [Candidatus Pacearchaeota archaeon]|nr:hypothetical protein [Candidatus Pacearchaeota archaeon]
MNWKEFFIPSWKKFWIVISLFFIFRLSFFLLLILVYSGSLEFIVYFFATFNYLINPLPLILTFFFGENLHNVFIYNLKALPILILYYYLLACIITKFFFKKTEDSIVSEKSKEFFKLKLNKISIAVILFLFYQVLIYLNNIRIANSTLSLVIEIISLPVYVLSPYIYIPFLFNDRLYNILSEYFLIYPVMLFYNYLIACIIIFAYNKIKHKNN